MPLPSPDPPSDDSPAVVPCRHLRSKGMYVYTDGSQRDQGDYDNTVYWCLRSMKSFGPDDDMVDREACCDASRTCYEPM